MLIKSLLPFFNVSKHILFRRIKVFLGTPVIYTTLVKAKILRYFKRFNKAKYFICESALFALQTIKDFELKFPRACLNEGYGLKERSFIVIVNGSNRQKTLRVGILLVGYEIKIVDENILEVTAPGSERGGFKR